MPARARSAFISAWVQRPTSCRSPSSGRAAAPRRRSRCRSIASRPSRNRRGRLVFRLASFVALIAGVLSVGGFQPQPPGDALARHRNLGKAFYENPTTQQKAVDEFKAALDLAPASARERINYGLALLRAGRTADAVAELS